MNFKEWRKLFMKYHNLDEDEMDVKYDRQVRELYNKAQKGKEGDYMYSAHITVQKSKFHVAMAEKTETGHVFGETVLDFMEALNSAVANILKNMDG